MVLVSGHIVELERLASFLQGDYMSTTHNPQQQDPGHKKPGQDQQQQQTPNQKPGQNAPGQGQQPNKQPAQRG